MVSTSWSRFPQKLICCVGFGSTSRVFCSLKSVQKKPPEVFYKKGVLENFTKFTGKKLAPESLF